VVATIRTLSDGSGLDIEIRELPTVRNRPYSQQLASKRAPDTPRIFKTADAALSWCRKMDLRTVTVQL